MYCVVASLTLLCFCLRTSGRVDEQFEFRDPRNLLIGELGEDSQFEVGPQQLQPFTASEVVSGCTNA